jgi:hypothetical protein
MVIIRDAWGSVKEMKIIYLRCIRAGGQVHFCIEKGPDGKKSRKPSNKKKAIKKRTIKERGT